MRKKSYGFNRKVKHSSAPKVFGGTGVLVKNSVCDIYSIKEIDKCVDGILGLHFQDKQTNFSFIIFSCYLPPDGSPYANVNEFFGHLLAQLYLYNNVDLTFVCGDINARIGALSDTMDLDAMPKRHIIDNTVHGHGESLIEFLIDAKMCVLNGRFDPQYDNFTCISGRGRSVVDYIITHHDCFTKCSDFKVYTSTDFIDKFDLQHLIHTRCKPPDHSILTCTFQTMHSTLYDTNRSHTLDDHSNGSDTGSPRRYRFNRIPDNFMNNAKWRQVVVDLIDVRLESMQQQEEIDAAYSHFCTALISEMDEYLQYSSASKSTRKRLKMHKPFWNNELTVFWKDMKTKEHLFNKCNGNRQEKTYRRNAFLNCRKVFDRELRRAERAFDKKLLNDIENVCTDNPRAFWDHIKKLGPRKSSNIPMSVYSGSGSDLVSDFETVLNTWRDEFSGLYNRPVDQNVDFDNEFYADAMNYKNRCEYNMSQPDYISNDFLNGNISLEEVEKVLNRLKNNKACGFDCIPNEVLKNKDVKTVLHKLFDLYFKYGKVPSIWLKTIISPIPKSSTKDPHVPLNYRGISLISCVAKAYSSLLNRRIVNYCEQFNIYNEEQNGFRHDRSCVDHIFAHTCIIRNRLNDKQSTYCCYIDMQKAFDWVDRDLLFYKLLLYNIDGPIFNAVKSLYSDPVACVKLNRSYTDWFGTNSGVKQGDSLSPTLFCIFINDLITEINNLELGVDIGTRNLSILVFADDIVLMGDSEIKLQTMLTHVERWCRKWRLSVNKDKTKVVHFRNRRKKQTDFKFMFDGSEIEKVSQYKYLGVLMDEYLNFEVLANVLAGAGGRALGAVLTKFRSFGNIGFNSFSKLYDSSVAPVLEYGSEVWGYAENVKCERIQQRACRYYIGVHPKTPILALTGDMGWVPAQIKRHRNMIRYWNRMVEMNDARLTKQMFLYDVHRCNNNWSSEVKSIFNSIDLGQIFDDLHVCDIEDVYKKCESNYNERWQLGITLKPKLRTYVTFKQNFDSEEYVKYCYSRHKRSLIAQFRMGVLPLAIETGRFRSIPLEERLCVLCDVNVIEDEKHFLCNCKLYEDIRQTMYDNVSQNYQLFPTLNVDEKFHFLVMNEWKEMGVYLQCAWERRNSILYESR